MRYLRSHLVMAIGLGCVLSCGAQAAPARKSVKRTPAPPYSYLRHNSPSLEEVIRQVSQSPQLQKRYAKHFNIPEQEVVTYFRTHLVESYIPKTQKYPVWCVKPDGTRFVVQQTFQSGTRVLSLRNGEPVLKWACGNPLSRTLPKIEKKQVVRKSKVLPREQSRVRTFEVVTPFEKPRTLLAQAPPVQVPPSEMGRITFREAPPVHRVRFPWQITPGLILTGTSGGGGGETPIPPIPEPASLVLLGLGTAGIISAKYLRRS